MPSIKLGELLVKANVINESQLKAALVEQHKWGGRIGDILVRMSLVTEDTLVRALAKQLGIQQTNLGTIQGIPQHVKDKIPAEQAREMTAVPLHLRDEGKTLVVAMAEPQNLQYLDTLRLLSKCRIVPTIAGHTEIQRAFGRFYEGEADVSDMEGSFKVLDAQGRTVVKALGDQASARPAPPAPAAPAPPPKAAPAPPASGVRPPAELLKSVEEIQRREVAVLKAMVELLIEKGVFTRDEYVAKIRR
jgi:hypothetical protein